MNIAKNVNDHAEKLQALTNERLIEIEKSLDEKFELQFDVQTKALKMLLDERLPKKS